MKPIIIGIAGGSGSGKSTLTAQLVSQMNREELLVLEHDSYYLDAPSREKLTIDPTNFDHPCAYENQLVVQHLYSLGQYKEISIPIYDFSISDRVGYQTIAPKPIIIVEGILILAIPEIRELLDLKVYLDTDCDTRLVRRIQRDTVSRSRTIESIIHQYESTVKPMHEMFVEPSKKEADLIIHSGKGLARASEILSTYLNQFQTNERLANFSM